VLFIIVIPATILKSIISILLFAVGLSYSFGSIACTYTTEKEGAKVFFSIDTDYTKEVEEHNEDEPLPAIKIEPAEDDDENEVPSFKVHLFSEGSIFYFTDDTKLRVSIIELLQPPPAFLY
jgi:hypothetical protein